MSGGDLKEDLRSAGVADVRDVLEARLEAQRRTQRHKEENALT
jgi:hypothetical protein